MRVKNRRSMTNISSGLQLVSYLLVVLCCALDGTGGEPKRPPNYHHDHMPETSFTCTGKVVGGYYADPDADCQMFHVCVQVDEHDVRDFKFMCPDDTVFDQENFICANWFEIDCRSSTLYYEKNLQLFQKPDESKKSSANNKTQAHTPEEPSELQKRQQEQQLQQLHVLEEQHQQQVLRQQQVLELHERRQQEHQRQQLKIVQDQQRLQEQLLPQDKTTTTTTTTPTTVAAARQDRAIVTASPSTNALNKTNSASEDKEVVEYDYYYYEYNDETTEQGHFYLNDEYDPNSPTRIRDPTNARPPLLPIIRPLSPNNNSTRLMNQ